LAFCYCSAFISGVAFSNEGLEAGLSFFLNSLELEGEAVTREKWFSLPEAYQDALKDFIIRKIEGDSVLQAG
jgi:hypothetical protein